MQKSPGTCKIKAEVNWKTGKKIQQPFQIADRSRSDAKKAKADHGKERRYPQVSERAEVKKRGILFRATAALLVAAMISGILVYQQTGVIINPEPMQNKAVRLAAKQLLADNDYANASRLERMSEYTRNLLSGKKSSGDYRRAAQIEIARENYQEAITLTSRAIEGFSGSDPEIADLYFQMGYLHVMENEFAEALKWLDLGMALTDSPEAKLVRAQVKLNLGDMDAAVKDVTAYMDAVGSTTEYMADLINVYEAAGNYETAALMYTRMIETEGTADSYLHRAFCYIGIAQNNRDPVFMHRAAADRDAYEKAGGRETATADVMLGIGWMRIEQYSLAGERFIAALNEGYGDPESLYYYIVLCSYCSENYRQASTYGDQLIDRVSRGESGHVAEMDLEGTTGKLNVKLTEMDFPFLCQMTGASYMKIGNFNQAIQCLTMCLSLEPERATARYYRGVCLLKLKRYQEAEEDFNRAIAGNGEPEKSHYSRAICRIKLDNAAGAMEDFDWILLNGTDEELFQAASGMMAQLMAGEIPAIDEE